MIKAIGFNQGQFGDLCMNLIACRAFKNAHDENHLTFGINKKYQEIAPLFLNNPLIDDIHIWDGYDNWPTRNDEKFIEESNFDKIFHPMERLRPSWQPFRHQTQEICLVHGLQPPEDLQIFLNKFFDTKDGYKKYISICHSGATDSKKKNLSEAKIDKICELIIKYGYSPLFYQNKYKDYDHIDTSFFESVQYLLSTKLLITIDSAMCWIASGYKFPTIGLYNQNYYSQYGAKTSANWHPINGNAIYLEAPSMEELNIDLIENAINSI